MLLLSQQPMTADGSTHYKSSSMNLKHLAFPSQYRNQNQKNVDGNPSQRTKKHKRPRDHVAVPGKMQILSVMGYSPENWESIIQQLHPE